MRARAHAVTSLRAARMDAAPLEGATQPDDVAQASAELMGPALTHAEQAGALAAQSVDALEESRQQIEDPVGPPKEQTLESLRAYAGPVLNNIGSLFRALGANDEAMLAGSAVQTLRLAWMAGELIAEPRAEVPTTPDERAVQAQLAREVEMSRRHGILPASPRSSATWSSIGKQVTRDYAPTCWPKQPRGPGELTFASSVALLTAAAAVQATAGDYFARVVNDDQPSWPPPPHRLELRSYLTERPDFAAFAEGGRAELRWQAGCVRDMFTLPYDERESGRYS